MKVQNNDIPVYLSDEGVYCVSEQLFYAFATRAKRLVEDQRKALRTKSKKSIEDCKARERALLDWVTLYEAARFKFYTDINLNI